MTNTAAEYPEFLAELAEKMTELGAARGLPANQAKDIGIEAAEWAREQWGGFEVYIPKGRSLGIFQRDRAIWSKWNGRNAVELCREHKISEVQLRNILKKMRRQDISRRQPRS